jgi:hypothetical protein
VSGALHSWPSEKVPQTEIRTEASTQGNSHLNYISVCILHGSVETKNSIIIPIFLLSKNLFAFIKISIINASFCTQTLAYVNIFPNSFFFWLAIISAIVILPQCSH